MNSQRKLGKPGSASPPSSRSRTVPPSSRKLPPLPPPSRLRSAAISEQPLSSPRVTPRPQAPTGRLPPLPRPSARVGQPQSTVTARLPAPYELRRCLNARLQQYEACDLSTGRRLLATLTPGLAKPEAWGRVQQIGKLQHPVCVRLLDAGTSVGGDPCAYTLEEYVEGESLARRLARVPHLSATSALHIAWHLLGALQHAHELGVPHGSIGLERVVLLHREVAPDFPRVKLAGFLPEGAQPAQLAASAAFKGDLQALVAMIAQMLSVQPEELRSRLERMAGKLVAGFDDVGPSAFAGLIQFRQLLKGAIARQAQSQQCDDLMTWPTYPMQEQLLPTKNRLMNERHPTLWVLEGDPALGEAAVAAALDRLGAHYKVVSIDQEAAERTTQELLSHPIGLPHVLLFGDMAVLAEHPLLALLSGSPEVGRVQVSSHQSVELLQTSIAQAEPDQHVCLPSDTDHLLEAIALAKKRAVRAASYYDATRIALSDAREELNQFSQSIAAQAQAVGGPPGLRR